MKFGRNRTTEKSGNFSDGVSVDSLKTVPTPVPWWFTVFRAAWQGVRDLGNRRLAALPSVPFGVPV
jgi:hypothetical protein